MASCVRPGSGGLVVTGPVGDPLTESCPQLIVFQYQEFRDVVDSAVNRGVEDLTPEAIAEAWGAGFVVALPVLLAIFGGRAVLKSLFFR